MKFELFYLLSAAYMLFMSFCSTTQNMASMVIYRLLPMILGIGTLLKYFEVI